MTLSHLLLSQPRYLRRKYSYMHAMLEAELLVDRIPEKQERKRLDQDEKRKGLK